MKIAVYEPGRKPYVKEIDGSLESMQEIVDGPIEIGMGLNDNNLLICNEEGLLQELPLQILFGRMFAGTCFVCGTTGQDFTDFNNPICI